MQKALFSTESVRPMEQMAYWNDAICNVFTALQCQLPRHRKASQVGYQGSLEYWDLGKLQIAKVTADPSRVDHDKHQVAMSNEALNLLHLQINGSSINTQGDREASLRPGDFTICDSTEPYHLHFDEAIEMLVVRIPQELTRKYFSNKRSLYGHHFSAADTQGVGGLFNDYIQGLWNHREALVTESQLASASDSALSLLACHLDSFEIFGSAADDKSTAGLLKTIQLYIDNNAANPDLPAELVAAAHNISARYLRSLFAAEGLTCSGYIASRRMAAATRYLSEPQFGNLKIIDIAFLSGFQSTSHFSRKFREQCGMSPKDYRRLHLTGC